MLDLRTRWLCVLRAWLRPWHRAESQRLLRMHGQQDPPSSLTPKERVCGEPCCLCLLSRTTMSHIAYV